MSKPLEGQVAVVAGATRGAGRGIAIELAAAGTKVYCTGRSVRGAVATSGRSETIDETASMIAAAGGKAVPVRVDHTVEREVEALAARVRRDEKRLDILVNDIWGGDEMVDWESKFWTLDIAIARRLVDQAVFSHLLTSRHLAPLMVEARRGLIVEITDGEMPGYRGQLLFDLVKSSINRLAYGMAWDLVGTGVTAVAVSPGFLRSEAMLDRFGVSEANWRDAAKNNPDFAYSETPRYVGRAVAALAADSDIGRKAGLALWGGDLADEYDFNDVDGSRPNFWRNMGAWLDDALSKGGDLDPHLRWLGGARYAQIHLAPAHTERARRYQARLGFERLGAGLQPIV